MREYSLSEEAVAPLFTHKKPIGFADMIKEIQSRLSPLHLKRLAPAGLRHDLAWLCAELLSAAFDGIRGWHYREDHPQQDDQNCSNGLFCRMLMARLVLVEDIPIDRYKFKP